MPKEHEDLNKILIQVEEMQRTYEDIYVDVTFMLTRRFKEHAEVAYGILYFLPVSSLTLRQEVEKEKLPMSEKDELILNLLAEAREYYDKAKQNLLRAVAIDKAERKGKRDA